MPFLSKAVRLPFLVEFSDNRTAIIARFQSSEMSNKRHESSLPPMSFGYMPWLIQLHGSKKPTQNFINPFDGGNEEKIIPMMKGKICFGVFGEWILLMDTKSKHLTLLSLTLDQTFNLSHLPEPLESIGGFILSSPVTSTKCTIVFVSKCEKFILFSFLKARRWNKVEFKLDYSYNDYCFTGDITFCKGKLYALLSPIKRAKQEPWKTIVIDVEAMTTGVFEKTTITNPRFPIFSLKKLAVTNHLVVSGEVVYLVYVFIFRGAVRHVNTYILGMSEPSEKQKVPELYWNSVPGIGRRIFFLSRNYSTSFSANNVRGSSIYLLRQEEEERLYKISLDDGISSFSLLNPELTDWENKLFWVLPSRSRSNKWGNSSRQFHSICSKEINETAIYKRGESRNDVSRPWANMPIEMVELLLSKLILIDRVRIPSVCKAWSSLSSHSMGDGRAWPLLMHCPKYSTACSFYDPLYGHKYNSNIKELESCEKIRSSNNGWLLITRSYPFNSAYILNPFTGVKFNLPSLPIHRSDFCEAMTISSDRTVILIWNENYTNRQIKIFIWLPEKKHWINKSVLSNDFKVALCTNLIFLDRKLYCFGKKGYLGIFYVETEERQIVDVPEFECENTYLLEYKGKVFSFFRRDEAEPIGIYMLDESDPEVAKWTKIEDIDNIGDITVFLDNRASFAIPSPLERFSNRIYFPRYDGDESGRVNCWKYYSMKNRSYHPKCDGLKEPMNCVWIAPNSEA